MHLTETHRVSECSERTEEMGLHLYLKIKFGGSFVSSHSKYILEMPIILSKPDVEKF